MVHAFIVTHCSEAKAQNGETFMSNRTDLHSIQKFPFQTGV